IVLAALEIGNAILLLSALSFLGLGARPPAAEWGSMVSTGAQHFEAWWIGVFPGLAILTVVLAFNFLGDSLRDAFDPKTVIRARGACRRCSASATSRSGWTRLAARSRSSTGSASTSTRAACSVSPARAAAARRSRRWR